jgi:hypothetical protein
MSIAYVDGKLEEVRAEAKSAQNQYTATIETINGDRSLSEEGRQAEIAQWRAATKEKVDACRAKELTIVNAAIADREKQIDSKMGNTSSDIIAFRDAQDRAERIESADDAQRVLERALRNDDSSLAGAVFRRSLEAGWQAPIDTLTRVKPEIAEAVNDLSSFTKFRDNSWARTVFYSTF